ncbi:hypothetical protein BCR39DRAFT_48985 [Naematelia encephala]|uniref:Uncharacterized protein n=1 Tax=Naematelia encephala TaxID=71784 RepID=A0A1Y2AH61_9TREE|nr:hypothetical protein BCR39DRAFT_48985 [Naematelia encephala]
MADLTPPRNDSNDSTVERPRVEASTPSTAPTPIRSAWSCFSNAFRRPTPGPAHTTMLLAITAVYLTWNPSPTSMDPSLALTGGSIRTNDHTAPLPESTCSVRTSTDTGGNCEAMGGSGDSFNVCPNRDNSEQHEEMFDPSSNTGTGANGSFSQRDLDTITMGIKGMEFQQVQVRMTAEEGQCSDGDGDEDEV